jgi:hypothetical protein
MKDISTIVLTTKLGASKWVVWGGNIFEQHQLVVGRFLEPAWTTNNIVMRNLSKDG